MLYRPDDDYLHIFYQLENEQAEVPISLACEYLQKEYSHFPTRTIKLLTKAAADCNNNLDCFSFINLMKLLDVDIYGCDLEQALFLAADYRKTKYISSEKCL